MVASVWKMENWKTVFHIRKASHNLWRSVFKFENKFDIINITFSYALLSLNILIELDWNIPHLSKIEHFLLNCNKINMVESIHFIRLKKIEEKKSNWIATKTKKIILWIQLFCRLGKPKWSEKLITLKKNWNLIQQKIYR